VLFALVASRALALASKLAAAEWVTHDVAIPGLAGLDEDQAYWAMDLLVEADTDAAVQEAVFFAVADLLNLEVDLLFFDTTSTYFERDTEDPPTPDTAGGEDGGAAGFRRYGHSKNSRPDLPQIVIGLAVTREGIPVRMWCWPGNATDFAVLPQVKDDLRCCRRSRTICAPGDWAGWSPWSTAGSPPRLIWTTCARPTGTSSPANGCGRHSTRGAVARPAGRYRTGRDNLRIKEVRLDSVPDLRWVLCHNPDEADRQAA
jgi:hypothetical protein